MPASQVPQGEERSRGGGVAHVHVHAPASQVLQGEEQSEGKYLPPQELEREFADSHALGVANMHYGRMGQEHKVSRRMEGEEEDSLGSREGEQEKEQGLLPANSLPRHLSHSHIILPVLLTHKTHAHTKRTHNTPKHLLIPGAYASLTHKPQTQDIQSHRSHTQDPHTSPDLMAAHLSHVARPSDELHHYQHDSYVHDTHQANGPSYLGERGGKSLLGTDLSLVKRRAAPGRRREIAPAHRAHLEAVLLHVCFPLSHTLPRTCVCVYESSCCEHV